MSHSNSSSSSRAAAVVVRYRLRRKLNVDQDDSRPIGHLRSPGHLSYTAAAAAVVPESRVAVYITSRTKNGSQTDMVITIHCIFSGGEVIII